jgi:hypothetical protein
MMRDGKPTMSKMDSAYLRQRLENHLAVIFANQTIFKYLEIDGCGPELQIMATARTVSWYFRRSNWPTKSGWICLQPTGIMLLANFTACMLVCPY